MLTLAEAQALLPTSRLVGDGAVCIARVASDTRKLNWGDLFVALKGERFDAHDFLREAKAAGAAAAIAERGLVDAGLDGLIVADTRAALSELAAAWRAKFALPLVAVTGSNGKTTVTQMLASILREWLGDAQLATEGNLNNDIGVPLTLLRLRATHRAAVVELGMNHPGEIAQLARLAAPTVALVNNAQREHQEFMASVEAVARENGAVIEALGPNGTAVFPAADAFAPLWHGLAAGRKVSSFALDGTRSADVTGSTAPAAGAQVLTMDTPAGRATLSLRLAGRHNASNALAGAACALAAGCPLEAVVRGLEAFEPVKGRSRALRLVRHGVAATLIDDSYNANPDSVRAAIDVLAESARPSWLVLGDMGEVGANGPAFHAEVGAHARAQGIDALWCAGELCAQAAQAFGPAARHFATVDALLEALPAAPAFSTALVKGSRFMRMERVVAALAEGKT
jgi:UDP-N-acetylmuramoyl-tripeptide--D-alanyl-D-alanine ligase